VGEGVHARAEIIDFWAMVFNPSSVDRLSHVLCGAWQAGAWLMVSVSAWYLLKRRHVQFAQRSIRVGLTVALVASGLQLLTGHRSAHGVAVNQPAKLAAFEGHHQSEPATLWLFGWVDEKEERVRFGIGLPRMLTFLVHTDFSTPVKGLADFKKEDRPPVQVVFQTYHAMVAIGLGLIGLAAGSMWLLWKKQFFRKRWLMRVLVFSVLGPQFANQFGWWSAEVGRQPWIVYGLLRTPDGLSRMVKAEAVLASLIMFLVIYLLLFAVFVYLLNEKIQHGPDDADLTPSGKLAVPDRTSGGLLRSVVSEGKGEGRADTT
jgi:cytochrome d ubiquinol oxidase subunit I